MLRPDEYLIGQMCYGHKEVGPSLSLWQVTMCKIAILCSEKLKEYDLGHMLTRDRNENFLGLFQERLGHYSDFKIVTPSMPLTVI